MSHEVQCDGRSYVIVAFERLQESSSTSTLLEFGFCSGRGFRIHLSPVRDRGRREAFALTPDGGCYRFHNIFTVIFAIHCFHHHRISSSSLSSSLSLSVFLLLQNIIIITIFFPVHFHGFLHVIYACKC